MKSLKENLNILKYSIALNTSPPSVNKGKIELS